MIMDIVIIIICVGQKQQEKVGQEMTCKYMAAIRTWVT